MTKTFVLEVCDRCRAEKKTEVEEDDEVQTRTVFVSEVTVSGFAGKVFYRWEICVKCVDDLKSRLADFAEKRS